MRNFYNRPSVKFMQASFRCIRCSVLLISFLSFNANSQTFYSRQNGNWNDPNSWSNVSHTGPASGVPGSSGTPELERVIIGNNNTITLTQNINVYGLGFTIDAGAILNANNFNLNLYLSGTFGVLGNLINPNTLTTYNSVNLNAPNTAFQDIVVESNYNTGGGGGGRLKLLADLHTYAFDVTVTPAGDPGTFGENVFDANGFNVSTNIREFYYSRKSGNWNDPNTWSNVSHTGAPALDAFSGSSGTNVIIGPGHTVTATGDIGTGGGNFEIKAGGVVNVAGNDLNLFGDLKIDGTLLNTGTLSGSGTISTSNTTLPIFDRILYGIGNFNGSGITLETDIVVYNGVQAANDVDDFVFDLNGYIVYPCIPPTTTSFSPMFNNIKGTSMDMSWTRGDGDKVLILARGSTTIAVKPQFGTTYTANAIFGSGDSPGPGNFVVYNNSGTSVSLTGLSPATEYTFDFFEYKNSGQCYLTRNYQEISQATCNSVPAPANPVNNAYCANDPKPAINVNSPGAGRNIKWYDAATAGNLVSGDVSGGDGRGGTFIPNAASGTFYAENYDQVSSCSSDVRTAVTLTLKPVPVVTNQTPIVCETVAGSSIANNISLTTYELLVTGGLPSTSVIWYRDASLNTTVTSPGSVTVDNSTNKIFYAKVTNTTTNCYSVASVTFTVSPLLNAIISGTLGVCPNAKGVQYNATGTGSTYTWETDAGTIVTGQGTNTITVDFGTSSGYIKVTPTGTCGGSSDKKNIAVDPQANSFATTGGGLYCVNGTGVLIGLSNSEAGIKYELFRNNITTNTFVTPGGGAFNFPAVTQAGTYSAKALTPSNCATDMKGTAVVTQSSLPSGTGIINGNINTCTGGTETYLTAGILSATSYIWTLPAGIELVSQNANQASLKIISGSGGSISVAGKNDCGNGGTASLSIQVQPSDVKINIPSEIVAEEIQAFSYTSSTTINSQQWNFGDGDTSPDKEPTHTYSAGGVYTITLEITTDNKSCKNTDVVVLNVKAKPELGNNSIKNAVTANGDNKNDFLIIEKIERYPNNEVVVLDRWGIEVFKQKAYNNDWNFKKGDNYLPAGNYVCIVKFNDTGNVITRTVTLIKGR